MITITQVGREAGANEGKAWKFRTDDENEALQRFAKKIDRKGSFRIDSRDGNHLHLSLMGVPGYGRGIKYEVVVS